MPRTRPPYPLPFRQQIVELAKAGRTPRELAQEFEPSEQTIRGSSQSRWEYLPPYHPNAINLGIVARCIFGSCMALFV
jgi:hypothetical protein